MNLSPRQLKIFVSLAHTLSFSRTAERFHISQPTLSKIVRAIESEFGVPLFERTTRQVKLTPDGIALLHVAARLTEEYDQGIAELHEVTRRRRQQLAVAALPTLAARLLPHLISGLQTEFPEASIRVHDVPADITLDLLRARKVDIALTTLDPVYNDLVYEEILRDQFVLLAPRGLHVDIPGGIWSETRLNQLPLITMPRGTSTRQPVDAAFLREGLQFRPKLELANLSTIRTFVEEGCGIALLPRLGAELIHSELLAIHPLIGAPQRSIGFITRTSEEPTALGKRLMAAVRCLTAQALA